MTRPAVVILIGVAYSTTFVVRDSVGFKSKGSTCTYVEPCTVVQDMKYKPKK